MGFADMQWKAIDVIPRTYKGRKLAPPTIRLYRHPKAVSINVTMTRATAEALHLTPGESHIAVLLNHRAIAIRQADPGETSARKLDKQRRVTVRELANLIKPGESWGIDVTIEDGAAWGVLPDQMVERLKGGAA